jgi:hypothetical protein
MSLVARFQQSPETISEMEKAALSRFREGQFLVQSGWYDSGIYLLGYVAEMLLKTAYCRVDPQVRRNFLVASRLTPARRYWRTTFGDQPSGHDRLFLALSIEDDRPRQGKTAWPVATARLFNTTIDRIAENWTVEMRYHQPKATQVEANDMLVDVGWLRRNYEALWR